MNKRYLETIHTEEFSFEAMDTNSVGHSIYEVFTSGNRTGPSMQGSAVSK